MSSTMSSGSTASADPTIPGTPTPPVVLWVSAVVTAALVAAGVMLLVPQIATDGDDRVGRAAGVQELGPAPGSDGAGSAPGGVPIPGTPAEPGAVAPPGPTVDQPDVAVSGVVVGQPGVVALPADLTAAYAIDARGNLLSVRFEMTISNAGASAGGWDAVVMGLSGLNLIVTVGKGVGHEVRNGHHVFAPLTPEFATVPARGAVTWTFTVTGVLTGVVSCALDGKACISPAPA